MHDGWSDATPPVTRKDMPVARLNWRIILLLSLFGPINGLIALRGLPSELYEKLIWLPAVLVSAWVIARFLREGHFGNGAIVGLIAGASAKLIEGVFASTYWAHNPWLAEALAGRPEEFHFQRYVLNLVPYVGVASALIQGLLSHVASRVIAPREVSS